jgi:hypothetical protein
MVCVCAGVDVPPLVRGLPLAADGDAVPLTGFGQTFTFTHFRPRRRRTVLHLGFGFAGFFDDLTDPGVVPTGAAPADGATHARPPHVATTINVRATRAVWALRPRRD